MHFAAATVMWVLYAMPGASVPQDVLQQLVALIKFPDPLMLRYTPLIIWLLARRPDQRRPIGEAGTIEVLLGWAAVLLLVLRSHTAGKEQSAATAAGPQDLVARIRTRVDEGPDSPLQLLEHVLAALWLLSADPQNTDRAIAAGAVETLQDVLRLQSSAYGEAMHMAVATLFIMSEHRPQVRERVVELRCVKFLIQIATNRRVATHVRKVSFDYLHNLSLEGPENAAYKSKMATQLSMKAKLELLVSFLDSKDAEAQRYGASMLARIVRSQHHKRLVARHDGAKRLVALLRNSRNGDVVRDVLHALLNLTTEATCQALVGELGTAALVDYARLSDEPAQRAYAARVLHNLARNQKNRTRLYKAELRSKTADWATAKAQFIVKVRMKQYSTLGTRNCS